MYFLTTAPSSLYEACRSPNSLAAFALVYERTSGVPWFGDEAVDIELICVILEPPESDLFGFVAKVDGSLPIVRSKHSTSLIVAGRNIAADLERRNRRRI